MPASRYQVVLHALAPDATDTGSQYADTTLNAVSAEQLRKLLSAFDHLAARPAPTDAPRPEIRIRFPAGLAMIAPFAGKLYYTSWDTKGRGIQVSVDDIMSIVAATAEPARPGNAGSKSAAPVRKPATRKRRFAAITLLGIAIVAMNITTGWMLLKPPPTILPPHVFLPDAESDALLQQLAGVYQTGPREGDRHLEIEKLGLLHFAVYGKNHKLRRESLQSARGARIAGEVAVITDANVVLRLKDPRTVVVNGDTYRRIAN